MLKLAHRILSTPDSALARGDWGNSHKWALDVIAMNKQSISSGVCVCCQNVWEYIMQTDGRPLGTLVFRPAFPEMFFEWISDNGVQMGALVVEVPMNRSAWPAEVRNAEHAILVQFWAALSGMAFFTGNRDFVFTDKDHQWIGCVPSSSAFAQIPRFSQAAYLPALLAMAFMNCKNVTRTDVTDTEGPPDKWLRRQKQPKLRYHVLNINPMKEVLRTEGGIEKNGLAKALHICRGHFATYTEEKPLFGHFVGTIWKESHVRGKAEKGMVIKDYKIN